MKWKAGKSLRLFERHSIPYLILKGFSLVDQIYEDSGIRPVSDIDIYIYPSDYARVHEILVKAGYRSPATATIIVISLEESCKGFLGGLFH